MTPRPIMVAAKTAWPTLAIRIGLASVAFALIPAGSVFERLLMSGPRRDHAGDITGQCGAEEIEGSAKPIDPGEDEVAGEDDEPDGQQEPGVEEQRGLCDCEVAEGQTEQDQTHAVARVETHPATPHGRLLRE